MKHNVTNTGLSRRASLVGLGAVILQGLGLGVASSDGGGEAGGQFNSGNSKKKKKKKKSKKVTVIYTQKNFRNISKKDLKTAIRGIDTGHNITVQGFSKKMSRMLFKTALLAQERMYSFITGMWEFDDPKRRRDELKSLATLLKFRRKELEKEVVNIFGTSKEIKETKAFEALMFYWSNNPKEGNL